MGANHKLRSACIGAVAVLLLLGRTAETAGPQPAEDSAGARLQAMAAHARSIQVRVGGLEAALRPEPILRYDDPPRHIRDATLWAWGDQGRPTAILKIENYPSYPPERRWVYGLVSLARGPITVKGDHGWRWSSTKAGLDLGRLERAPEPAATEALRLSQMKQLARRFEVHEHAGPARGRLQLRLLPRPILRYADRASGLEDGVLFGFAYGTNPDLIVAIESRRDGKAVPTWRYGLARLGGGATFVSLDGREVWSQPEANPPAERETYMNRRAADRHMP